MEKKKNLKRVKKVERQEGYYTDKICDFIVNLAIKVLKLVITLVIGALYGLYATIEVLFDKIFELIKKLPKMAKIGLFYGVVIIITILVLNPRVVEKYVGFETIKEKQVTKYVKIEDKTCKMDKYSCMIYLVGKEYGLTDEQSFMAVAISKHETGNYTSNAFKNQNNLGGIFRSGQLATFGTLEEGINEFVSLLKNSYFDKGLDTIEEIGNVYCPVGASNDPTGVNVHWIPMVTKYYNELIENYMEG
jgi:hypothetical protein